MKATERGTRVEAEVAGPLREAGAGLDDLRRARLAAAIEEALDGEDEARAEKRRRESDPRRRRRWRVAAATAVAGLALLLVVRPLGRHGQPAARPGNGTLAVASAPAFPRLYDEPRGAAARTLAPSTSLVALGGERARATVGKRVRLTLVGPGRVSVLAAPRDGDIELALESGRLLVDYDGHGGGTLRVRSPGALTTVVGTLFAVEVTGAESRVAVARGRVRTEAASGSRAEVTAGSSWTSADDRPAPIPDDLALALAEHAAGWATPSVEPDHGDVTDHAELARHRAARPPAEPALDALYAKAEAAMRARSLAEARRDLETIAARDPRGAFGETALLDLARLALADDDRAEARRALALLPRPLHDPALAETAQHLRCRAQQPDEEAAGDHDGCDGAQAAKAAGEDPQ